jgi:hypothetical protein
MGEYQACKNNAVVYGIVVVKKKIPAKQEEWRKLAGG